MGNPTDDESSPLPGPSVTPSSQQAAVAAQRNPSLRRSCELCRASKSRCTVSRDDPHRCQKCSSQGKQCVFVEARQRAKKMRTSKARVAEMENKLESLISLLSAGSQPAGPSSTPVVQTQMSNAPATGSMAISLGTFANTTPAPSDSTTSSNFREDHADFFNLLVPNVTPMQRSTNHDLVDVISKGIIGFEEAEYFVQDFKDYAFQFPFVIILPHENLDSIRRDRPFVLLSILAVTSQFKQGLQAAIEKELREFFAKKVIVDGVKTLDLLQGLLLYLAWYQFHFKPENQQIYQFSQMAIAMTVDLGITKPARGAPNIFEVGSGRTQLSPPEILEMRTYLGSIYLSSSLANGFRKPNNLRHTEYTDYCCRALDEMKEVPSDSLLTPLVQLERISDEVAFTFDYNGHNDMPPLSALRIEMLGNGFRKQLNQFQQNFSKVITENSTLRCSYYNLSIFISEIALHAISPTPPSVPSGPNTSSISPQTWYASAARADVLVQCFESTKAFLDQIVQFSDMEIRKMTMMDVIKLVYAIHILARFVLHLPNSITHPNFPSPDQLSISANLNYYLETLAGRANNLIKVVDGKEQIGYFWHFRQIFRNTRLWSANSTKSPELREKIGGWAFGLRSSDSTCVDMSFMRILNLEPIRSGMAESCPVDCGVELEANSTPTSESASRKAESNEGYDMGMDMGLDMGMPVPMGGGMDFEGMETMAGKEDFEGVQDKIWMDLVGEWNAAIDPMNMPFVENPNLYGMGPF